MLQPICVTNSYNGSVSLKVNRFKDGFTNLVWIDNSMNGMMYSSHLNDNIVTIPNLEETLYTFFTINPKTGEQTDEMTVYVKSYSPEEQVDRLWAQCEVEETDYNNALKEKLIKNLKKSPQVSLLYILYYLYENIEEVQDFETDLFYRLIIVQEKYENVQLGNLNRDGACFAKIRLQSQPVISMNENVNIIKVYQINGNSRKMIQVHRVMSDELSLTLPEHGYFEIQLLNDTDLLAVLRHCQLSTEYIAQVWLTSQALLEQYLNNVEDDYVLGSNDFSGDERTNYLEECAFNPVNTVFPRIEVEESEDRRAVSLKVSGVRFAEASERKFYVSGKDADYLQDTVQNEFFLIYGKTDVFNTNFEPQSNMIDTRALLYIVDDKNRIVSRCTRCYFDEDWTTDSSEYYENVREYEVRNFTRKFLTQISSSYENAYSIAQEISARCIENTGVTIDNVLEYFLNEIDTVSDKVDDDRLSFELLKYWFSLHEYDSEFFSVGGFTWAPYTKLLVTEESKEGYVLCIIKKEPNDDTFTRHYLHSKSDQAVQLLLNNYGKYIVYAVSEEDYRFSGFLFLDNSTGYTKSYLVNMGVR